MKTYKPTFLYILKIFGLIVSAGVSIFIVGLLSNTFRFFIKNQTLELVINIVIIISFLVAIIMVIRSSNPVITFRNKFFTMGNLDIYYDQIKDYYPSKGGSEPYLITKEGNRIDLELSWFSKKDQDAIRKTLLHKIDPNKEDKHNGFKIQVNGFKIKQEQD